MIDISSNEKIKEAVEDISRRVLRDNIAREEITVDYINYGFFEKSLLESNILIIRLELRQKSLVLGLISAEVAAETVSQAMAKWDDPGLFKFNAEKLSLDVSGKKDKQSDFFNLKTCLLSLPSNCLKEITVINLIEWLDYNENELIFKELFRILACGGKLAIECEDITFYFNFYQYHQKRSSMPANLVKDIVKLEKDIKKRSDDCCNFFSSDNILDYLLKNKQSNTIYSPELLKAYLEYCGFMNVFPKARVGEYVAGKIKVDAVKPGLKDIASLNKRVLLKIGSNKFKDLLSFNVFIRNLHNAFNKWDLLLVVDEKQDFFRNNIHLKYLSNVMPEESVDFVINMDNANSLPKIDYPLKHIDSGKPDIFFDNGDVSAAYEFLRDYGINVNEPFIILDYEYVKKEEQDLILNLSKKDFPYFNLYGFKVLNYDFKGGENSGLSLKMLASIINLSSFYAGSGFMFELADGLYVPAYDVVSGRTNYVRRNRDTECAAYDVSVIIPVFNNLEYTKNCLNSIFQHHPLSDFEIIVINNGSTDSTMAYLKTFNFLSNFIVINNDKNMGYAKACNQGAGASKGKYLHFLNNDTIVFKGAIDELVGTALKEGDKCGAVGSLLLYPDGTIQHAGVVFTDTGDAYSPYHPYKNMDIFESKDLLAKNMMVYTDYSAVTAASILLTKEIFFSLNLFDEIYENGFEDVDLCLKIIEAKKKIIFNPRSILVHFEAKTEGRSKHDTKNAIKLVNKWKFRYLYDNHIVAEHCNVKVFVDDNTLIVKYFYISFLMASESIIDSLLDDGDYRQAYNLCSELLVYDRLNIKLYRKKLKIEKLIKKVE